MTETERRQRLITSTPHLSPEEVASVIVFVASAVNTTINGDVIRVSGGATA